MICAGPETESGDSDAANEVQSPFVSSSGHGGTVTGGQTQRSYDGGSSESLNPNA